MEQDFLKSQTRKNFLTPIHELVAEEYMSIKEEDGGLLLRNNTERFRKWQEMSALGHWAVMRTVLPKEVWENW